MAIVDGEEVVFETRLHPASLAGAATFAACVIGATALIVHRNPLDATTVGQLWLGAAATIVVAVAAPVARWRSSRFAVTTQHLAIRTGTVRRRRSVVPLEDLAEVTVTPGLLGRLLGYGTVRIVTADRRTETFTRVAAPEALREAALRQSRPGRRRKSP